MPPTGDLVHNPDICSDWELNLWPFGLQASTQSTEPHQPGCVQVFVWTYFQFSWGYEWIFWVMITLCLRFWWTAKLHHFTFLSIIYEGSNFFTSFLTFDIVFFQLTHYKECEVVSHCDFDFYFLEGQLCWKYIHAFIAHFSVGLFGFLLLSCKSSSYILNTS